MKTFSLILLLLCGSVLADDSTLLWTNPDQQESCTAAGPVGEMGGTKIWKLIADIPDPTVTTFTVQGLFPGEHEFVATSYDINGVGSRISGSATKTIDQISVIEQNVKILLKIPGDFLLLTVGTIPLGTACDHTISVKGHYKVDPDLVDWDDPARDNGTADLPLVVVSRCQ